MMKVKASYQSSPCISNLTRTNVYLLDIDFGSRNQGQTLAMFPRPTLDTGVSAGAGVTWGDQD